MLLALAFLYVVACAARQREPVFLLGCAFSVLLHPIAALAALAIVIALVPLSRLPHIRALYVVVVLATLSLKNTLRPQSALDLGGVSFVLFQAYFFLSAVPRVRDIAANTGKLMFYPQLLCGPVIKPSAYDKGRFISQRARFHAHLYFFFGLLLKCWCADVLAPIIHSDSTDLIFPFVFAIWLYADFSGWGLMAAGIGLACGIRIPRNFRFPFRARTAVAFWARWNTTLNIWVREAIPIRKLGMAPARTRLIGMTVYAGVLALWHGVLTNFVLFALVNLTFATVQGALRRKWVLALSQVIFLAGIGMSFSGRLPTDWIVLTVSDLDRLIVGLAVFLIFESGGAVRLKRAIGGIERKAEILILLMVVFGTVRPTPMAFVYAGF